MSLLHKRVRDNSASLLLFGFFIDKTTNNGLKFLNPHVNLIKLGSNNFSCFSKSPQFKIITISLPIKIVKMILIKFKLLKIIIKIIISNT